MGGNSGLTDADLLHYLQNHPEFIEQHAEALGVRLPESKILSFQEGSLKVLRAKTEKMALQLHDIMENAAANRATYAKMLAFHRRLLAVANTNRCIDAVCGSLKEDFGLPHHCLAVLEAPANVRVRENCDMRGHADVLQAARKLKKVQCGTRIAPALLALLPQPARLESFLQLPVSHRGQMLALLLVGHEDAGYFHEALSTDLVEDLAASLAILLAKIWKLPA